MKKQILTLSDSNMAGDTWRWYFFLDGETGGAYSLSCEQILNGDAGSPIEPVTGLRRGAWPDGFFVPARGRDYCICAA